MQISEFKLTKFTKPISFTNFSLNGVRVPGQIAQQFQAEAPLMAQLKKQKKKVLETVKEVSRVVVCYIKTDHMFSFG